MINWRALVLALAPRISDARGIALTLLLGVVTVACVALVWRGPWAPKERLFSARLSLLILATLLVNYHSHAYGALLLAVRSRRRGCNQLRREIGSLTVVNGTAVDPPRCLC